jgi:hypothetical protein
MFTLLGKGVSGKHLAEMGMQLGCIQYLAQGLA